MDKRIPDDISFLLEEYVKQLELEFRSTVYGVYVYGSLALEAFDEKSSDIDFLTVLDRKLSQEDFDAIKAIHKKLLKISPYAMRLEGEYINLRDITNGKPLKQYPYFADGSYQGQVGLKYVAWYQLKERGITIAGKDFNTIAGEISWSDVRNELLDRLEIYWPKMASWKLLLLDKWAALIVLSICRIYYTVNNKAIISKCDGGEYAINKLPEDWHILINEALRIQRKTSKASLFNSKLERIKKIKAFIKYISDISTVKV